jgi:hypothetical protein
MDYFISFLQLIKSKPVVRRVYKNSIMGNEFNKTYDYYVGKLVPSPLDDMYIIEYTYKSKDYIIHASVEHLQDALDYVEKGVFEPIDDNIILAFETNDTDTYRDITEHIRKFYGPSNDFYTNEPFKVLKKHITKNNLYVIDKRYHIHSFKKNDGTVDIFSDARKLV